MPRGKKRSASSRRTSVQNESSRRKRAGGIAPERRDTDHDDAGAMFDGTISNSGEPLTRGDIPALVQEIVNTLTADSRSSTQQGKRQPRGQPNHNVTSSSSPPPQQEVPPGVLMRTVSV